MKKKILCILTNHDQLGSTGRKTGLWLGEFAEPYELFRRGGYEVVAASPAGGKVPIDPESLKSSVPDASTREYLSNMDDILDRTVPLHTVDIGDFAAIFYPGGHGPMWDLAQDCDNAMLLAEAFASGKIIGAVCHGPAALTGAVDATGKSVLANRRVTGFSNKEERAVGLDAVVPFSLEDRLKALAGAYTRGEMWQQHIEKDGTLITGQNPQSARAVGSAMLELLSQREIT